MQLAERGGGDLPCTFLKIGKKALAFEKNALIVLICFKFAAQNAVLGLFQRKNLQIFSGALF